MNASLFTSTQIGFAALTVIGYYFFLRELLQGLALTSWDEKRKAKTRNLIIGVPVLIAAFVSIWSLTGVMLRFEIFPLNFLPVLALPLIVALYLTFSTSFLEILRNIPAQNLVRLQTFRFAVEILLWALFINNLLPKQMSFEGRNFDILAGITAPVVSWLISRGTIGRTGLIIWNVLCLGLLINIVTIAILSTPSPIRVFMEEPANTIVAVFPISLLPGMLVPLAYVLHFFSLRQLLKAPSVATQLK